MDDSARLVGFVGATDLDAAEDELASRDVEFHVYEGMRQDRLGLRTTPSGTRVAWFHDPDGNVLSLQQGG